MRENEQKIKVLESFDHPNFVSTPREDGEGKNNSSLAIEFIDDSYTAMENVDRKILIKTIGNKHLIFRHFRLTNLKNW